MLTHNGLAIVRAALTFWREEMCPHGTDVMLPYLDLPDIKHLSADEVIRLRCRFKPDAVRYAIANAAGDRLTNTKLFVDAEDAIRAAGNGRVATVLLNER